MRHLRTIPWSGQADSDTLLALYTPCLPLWGSVGKMETVVLGKARRYGGDYLELQPMIPSRPC